MSDAVLIRTIALLLLLYSSASWSDHSRSWFGIRRTTGHESHLRYVSSTTINERCTICCTCCSCYSLFLLLSSYGPRASKKYSTPFSERGQFLVDFKFAPFAQSTRRAKRTGSAAAGAGAGNGYELEEKEIQQQLTEAIAVSIHLEAFPKAVLEAYVQVLQDEGGVLASALTCISLALADAGVMLYDMVTACEAVS